MLLLFEIIPWMAPSKAYFPDSSDGSGDGDGGKGNVGQLFLGCDVRDTSRCPGDESSSTALVWADSWGSNPESDGINFYGPGGSEKVTSADGHRPIIQCSITRCRARGRVPRRDPSITRDWTRPESLMVIVEKNVEKKRCLAQDFSEGIGRVKEGVFFSFLIACNLRQIRESHSFTLSAHAAPMNNTCSAGNKHRTTLPNVFSRNPSSARRRVRTPCVCHILRTANAARESVLERGHSDHFTLAEFRRTGSCLLER